MSLRPRLIEISLTATSYSHLHGIDLCTCYKQDLTKHLAIATVQPVIFKAQKICEKHVKTEFSCLFIYEMTPDIHKFQHNYIIILKLCICKYFITG